MTRSRPSFGTVGGRRRGRKLPPRLGVVETDGRRTELRPAQTPETFTTRPPGHTGRHGRFGRSLTMSCRPRRPLCGSQRRGQSTADPGPKAELRETHAACLGRKRAGSGVQPRRSVSSLSPTQRVMREPRRALEREAAVLRPKPTGKSRGRAGAGTCAGSLRATYLRGPSVARRIIKPQRRSTSCVPAKRGVNRQGDGRPMQMTSRLAPRAPRTIALRLLEPNRSVSAERRGQRPAWIVEPGAGIDGCHVPSSGTTKSTQLRETGRRSRSRPGPRRTRC